VYSAAFALESSQDCARVFGISDWSVRRYLERNNPSACTRVQHHGGQLGDVLRTAEKKRCTGFARIENYLAAFDSTRKSMLDSFMTFSFQTFENRKILAA